MRIAIISDIHGNLPALEAVLTDLAGRDVDLTVNLGDILSGVVQPQETADRLIPLNLPTVRGNHERQVLTDSPDKMGLADRLAREAMTTEHLDWFETLPPRLEISEEILAFHGSPTDDLTYLLETVEPDGVRPATEAEVMDRLGGETERKLLLCGHTHIQRSMRLSTGALVVNPGSVGWPAYDDDAPFPHVMEAGTPHARYAIAEDSSGQWLVEFHEVVYDWESAAVIAESNARDDVARALRTGRA